MSSHLPFAPDQKVLYIKLVPSPKSTDAHPAATNAVLSPSTNVSPTLLAPRNVDTILSCRGSAPRITIASTIEETAELNSSFLPAAISRPTRIFNETWSGVRASQPAWSRLSPTYSELLSQGNRVWVWVVALKSFGMEFRHRTRLGGPFVPNMFSYFTHGFPNAIALVVI